MGGASSVVSTVAGFIAGGSRSRGSSGPSASELRAREREQQRKREAEERRKKRERKEEAKELAEVRKQKRAGAGTLLSGGGAARLGEADLERGGLKGTLGE